MIASLVVAAAVSLVVLAPRAEAADAEAGRKKAERCGACHGLAGNSTTPTVPSLAGQPPTYTYYQLVLFRDERRRDPQMTPFAAGLSDADMQDIAAYYAAQPPAVPNGAVDPATAAAGQRLAASHFCTACHTPSLMGQQHVPRLAGQQHQYLLKQLRGFKTQTASDLDGSMTTSAQPLTDHDIEVLAEYLAHLPVPAR